MSKSINSLFNLGLLSFGREQAFYDLLKDCVDAKLEQEKNKTSITARKGAKKMVITITPKNLRVSGEKNAFKDDLDKVYMNTLSEYAQSVRSKKTLLYNLGMGEFFRFSLVPVLLESKNIFGVKMKELCKSIEKIGGEKKILFFKLKQKINATYKNNIFSVFFENAHFELEFKKPKIKKIQNDVEIGKFQADVHDAFYAGLPYTIMALNNYDFNYSFNGNIDSLKQLSNIILESLYKYLIVDNV